MNRLSAVARPGVPPAGLTREALGELFHEFSRASQEMERSHTELKAKVAALQRELAEKDRQLEQKKRLEALGLVVAGVAHEFRNPLGSVSLYLDCLADAVKDLPAPASDGAKKLIDRIESAVRHLNAVVEDMLIFTRGAPGPGEPCDLPRLAEETIGLLRADLDAAEVRCRCEVDPELTAASPVEGKRGPVVLGERDQIVRILINVIKNAVQAVAGARARGEGKVSIQVRRAPAARGRPDEEAANGTEYVEVLVDDNGPGVANERLEKLFVPFYTEKRGGVGLGLYIVHSLIERQGGRVEAENRSGGGLRMRLSFLARASRPTVDQKSAR